MTRIAPGRVSPFGHPGLNACVPLPLAYRSLPRPSSPPCAQASPTCLRSLDYITVMKQSTRYLLQRVRSISAHTNALSRRTSRGVDGKIVITMLIRSVRTIPSTLGIDRTYPTIYLPHSVVKQRVANGRPIARTAVREKLQSRRENRRVRRGVRLPLRTFGPGAYSSLR